MTSELSYQTTFNFAAPPNAVFDIIATFPDITQTDKKGALLAVDVIAGEPGTIGFQQQARFHFGPLDLIMIETIVAISRPRHLRVSQTPDRLQRHDPHERDIQFLDSMIENLDDAFMRSFGEDPADTEIDFVLDGDDVQTNMTITVQCPQKASWFQKRRWKKQVHAQVTDIAARITRDL